MYICHTPLEMLQQIKTLHDIIPNKRYMIYGILLQLSRKECLFLCVHLTGQSKSTKAPSGHKLDLPAGQVNFFLTCLMGKGPGKLFAN